MSNPKRFLQENKAATFDWLVLTVSFFLGFAFPSLREFIISPFFFKLMFAALVLYIVGSWLKHFPLYYRLIKSGREQKVVPYTLFLIAGHWVLMLTAITLALPTIRKILGMPIAKPEEAANGWAVFTGIAGATIITWLVFRTKRTLKMYKVYSPGYIFRRELAGDICLVISVSIFSFAFWEKGIIAMLSSKPTVSISDVWFLFIFLAIAYMLCYLPLRYLFLVEDHFSSKTWKRMLIIFGILLLKALFQMLNL